MRRAGLLKSIETLAILAISATPLEAKAPESAPPLPDPQGNFVRVTTESELQAAVDNLTSGSTIVIAPGVYDLSRPVHIRNVNGVALRGETGDWDDVVLQGRGMSDQTVVHGVMLENAENVLVADLTIRDVYYHPITLQAGTEAPHIYHVRLVNAGEQFIKGNTDGVKGADNGIVEYSVMEYDTVARSYYTNGVDILRGENWIVRHNRFRNIRSVDGKLSGPAILFWQQTRNPLVENNTIIDCTWGIAFGLGRDDDDNIGGIIRNNFIYRNVGLDGIVDTGILVWKSPGTKVLNNTVFLNGTYSSAIEYRFPNTVDVIVRNNLTDAAVLMRDDASALVESNVTNASLSWFTHPESGVLRLSSAAVDAIDKALPDDDVPLDWDDASRPVGEFPDIGADEFVPPLAADFDESGRVDFGDFLIFASAYGTREGRPNWNPLFDLNGDRVVGFVDFLLLASLFGSTG